jgi:hypothetical protein
MIFFSLKYYDGPLNIFFRIAFSRRPLHEEYKLRSSSLSSFFNIARRTIDVELRRV